MFRSLQFFNYRIWFVGAIVSNIGTWMQRTAQDWLVYDILTKQDAAAMGIVMALQLGPQLLMAPWSGLIADSFNRRHLLMITQVSMALLGLGLGLMVITGVVELWHVYAFALALGMVSSVDAPARQTFVSELVRDEFLPNAVALNSTSFNLARMVGPAVSGVLTVAVGPGWVFLINAATFGAMIAALLVIRGSELRPLPKAGKGKGRIREGFRYVRRRPDLMIVMTAIFIIGTFGLNFAIYIAAMARTEFGGHAGDFGLLSSVMAIGSVMGSLLAARRDRPRLRFIFGAAAAFAVSCTAAALAPNTWLFGLALVPIGVSALTIMTSANAYVQTNTDQVMRGRVMALYMAIFMGGTPIGAPIVGAVTDAFGPRWGLGVGALAGLAAALVGFIWAWRAKQMRFQYDRTAKRKLRITYLQQRP
ncbi:MULTISPECIES: MFS transporter [Crystallibacter]|uniref:MFS transporter n=1 Tax=Crystallibacter TaxID=3456524 RepID=UPI0014742B2E|nr:MULTISPECIES: MFS transporter [unclassified Arthrobacter]MCW2134742.1 putative arabinose efflux permease, MFS family [Arthrobacter sp. VKM Ac-2550]NMR31477.1 MFS transporter [Arthrobacter sp. SF27]